MAGIRRGSTLSARSSSRGHREDPGPPILTHGTWSAGAGPSPRRLTLFQGHELIPAKVGRAGWRRNGAVLSHTKGLIRRYTESRLACMSTTTVKVQASTRDQLLAIGASRHLSADQVIITALAALQRDERRQLAAAEARAIAADPVDLAEIRAIQDDIAALHEG